MTIRVKLAVILAERQMKLKDLSEKTVISINNLSILKTDKAKAIRFSTLNEICKALDYHPGELLEFINETNEEKGSK